MREEFRCARSPDSESRKCMRTAVIGAMMRHTVSSTSRVKGGTRDIRFRRHQAMSGTKIYSPN